MQTSPRAYLHVRNSAKDSLINDLFIQILVFHGNRLLLVQDEVFEIELINAWQLPKIWLSRDDATEDDPHDDCTVQEIAIESISAEIHWREPYSLRVMGQETQQPLEDSCIDGKHGQSTLILCVPIELAMEGNAAEAVDPVENAGVHDNHRWVTEVDLEDEKMEFAGCHSRALMKEAFVRRSKQ